MHNFYTGLYTFSFLSMMISNTHIFLTLSFTFFSDFLSFQESKILTGSVTKDTFVEKNPGFNAPLFPYMTNNLIGTYKEFHPKSSKKTGFTLKPLRLVFAPQFSGFAQDLYRSQLLGPNHLRMTSRGLRDTLPRVIFFLNTHVQLLTFGHTDFREVISNLRRSSNHV
jgi:hypothetical protein